jgi:hypothetical protein
MDEWVYYTGMGMEGRVCDAGRTVINAKAAKGSKGRKGIGVTAEDAEERRGMRKIEYWPFCEPPRPLRFTSLR